MLVLSPHLSHVLGVLPPLCGNVCARFRRDEGGVFIFDDNDALALVS